MSEATMLTGGIKKMFGNQNPPPQSGQGGNQNPPPQSGQGGNRRRRTPEEMAEHYRAKMLKARAKVTAQMRQERTRELICIGAGVVRVMKESNPSQRIMWEDTILKALAAGRDKIVALMAMVKVWEETQNQKDSKEAESRIKFLRGMINKEQAELAKAREKAREKAQSNPV